jgi:hypothetical protein
LMAIFTRNGILSPHIFLTAVSVTEASVFGMWLEIISRVFYQWTLLSLYLMCFDVLHPIR